MTRCTDCLNPRGCDAAGACLRPPEPESFAAWLRLELRRRGMSKTSLSERVGRTRQSVSDWTRGVSVPDLRSLILLLDAFGLEGDVRDRAERLAAGLGVTDGQ